MHKVPFQQSVKIIGRGTLNWLADRPIVVSFEVTDSCTCDCLHCDHGGARDASRNLGDALVIIQDVLNVLIDAQALLSLCRGVSRIL